MESPPCRDQEGGGDQLLQLLGINSVKLPGYFFLFHQHHHDPTHRLAQLLQVGQVGLLRPEGLHVACDGLLHTHPLPAVAVPGPVSAGVVSLAPSPPVDPLLQPVEGGDDGLADAQLLHEPLLVVAAQAAAHNGFE